MLGLPLLASLAVADEAVTVQVAVQLSGAEAGTVPWVATTWLGEDRRLALRDDGSAPGDAPGDGVYVGEWSGAPVRVLPVRVGYDAGGASTTAALYNEVLGDGPVELSYALALGDEPSVRRVARAGSMRAAEVSDLVRVAAALGWTGLVLGWVAWLVGRSPDPR